MAKMIKFQPRSPRKFGHKRVASKKRLKLEEFGQLNLFDQNAKEAKVVNFPINVSPFDEALLLDEQKDPRSKDAYRTAIKRKDHIADAFCNLGILESSESNIPEAFNCFTQSLKHNPRHFESHYNLANLYSDSGNLALARLHYEIALEIKPRDANVYYNLGLLLVINKDYPKALEVLEKYKSLTDSDEADNLIESLKSSLK